MFLLTIKLFFGFKKLYLKKLNTSFVKLVESLLYESLVLDNKQTNKAYFVL